jgi:chemotaxis protein methyltransferase CheR
MSQKILLNDKLKEAFHTLIAKQTGLIIRERDRNTFYEKIWSRIKSYKSISPELYYQFLASETLESLQEWEKLIILLTNNESYFFRDKEQLNILKSYIFPELIKRNRNRKTLRICSAGCSTGQEPYTIAILLKELLPDFQQWNILILGIDIDRKALEVAQKAIYEPWSFRGVDENLKKQYFQENKNQFYLVPEIKNLVKFQVVNLVKDPFPQIHSELKEMDLILCRNVFIYFENITIAKVLEKIYCTLQPSGYFLTGHTELSGVILNRFEKIAFPESIIYRRSEQTKLSSEKSIDLLSPSAIALNDKVNFNSPKTSLQKSETKLENFLKTQPLNNLNKVETVQVQDKNHFQNVKKILLEAEALLTQEKYELAIEKAQKILQIEAKHFQAHYLLAQTYANLGQYEQAIQACQQAIQIETFALAPYYLLAKIAEEKSNFEEAKRILKQIIYLEPNSVVAYLDLSHIYRQEGDRIRENKMQEAALNILQQLPPDTKIRERDNITVAELRVQLAKRSP